MPKIKNKQNQQVDKTEIIWPGKRKEVERVGLPFQTIETINLPRGARQENIFDVPIQQEKLLKDKKKQITLSGQDVTWKNRLIWGDNLLIMGSLLKEFAGKINLIYIDPPFATGDDFSFTVNIGDRAEVTKEPSALEVKAYRDTWGKGMQSYLQMMYDRLVLMKELLADNGSIYVHLDWHVGHYVKGIMDEIFGNDRMINEIIWRRTFAHGDIGQGAKHIGRLHDVIFLYTKSENYALNNLYVPYDKAYIEKHFKNIDKETGRRFQSVSLTAPGGAVKGNPYYEFLGVKRYWQYSKANMEKLLKEGKIYQSKPGTVPRKKMFLDESLGVPIQDIWTDISPVQGQAIQNVNYSTQKPEALLERVIKLSSKNGDLVADFFCGSGTTGVVAEKLGRRWIMSDLGRFAIHTTRKRLLDMSAKPFIVQNLGRYERHRWAKLNGRYKDYTKFILGLYHAEPVDGFIHLHGKKDKVFVRIGTVDSPVTLSEIREALEECKKNKIKKLDVLGWEWEMGLHDLVKEEAERYGVKLGTFQIPREVMELNVNDQKIKNDIHFYELAYLEIESKVKNKEVTITLKDFIIPNPELLPEEVKNKVKNWSDFIDYWAVDWNFNGDSFHNMDQRYRTRKEPKLELLMNYEYKKSGKYNILVKVIDIFGNDTTKLVEVKI